MAYGSFLGMLVEDVRLEINDPAAGAQFSESQILRWANGAMRGVFREVQRISSMPVVLSLDLVVPAGTMTYQLPPCIGTLIEIGAWDADAGRWSWTLLNTARAGPYRPSLHLSGNRIVLDAALDEDLDLRVEYKPSGDFLAHEGKRSFAAALLTGTQFALVEPASEAAGLLRGAIDDRQSAYVGATLRVWCPTAAPALVQERLVMASTVDAAAAGKTRLLTVDAAFSPALTQDGATEYQYELVPSAMESMRHSVVLATALRLCSAAGLVDRKNGLILDYRMALRTDRLDSAHADPRNQRWRKDTFHGVNTR